MHIVVAHNHVSGVVNPSKADIDVCQRIVKAGELIGVECADFIVVGDDSYLSFRENGLIGGA